MSLSINISLDYWSFRKYLFEYILFSFSYFNTSFLFLLIFIYFWFEIKIKSKSINLKNAKMFIQTSIIFFFDEKSAFTHIRFEFIKVFFNFLTSNQIESIESIHILCTLRILFFFCKKLNSFIKNLLKNEYILLMAG